MSAGDVDAVVAKARAAAASWVARPLDERCALVVAAANAAVATAENEDLATLLTRENGKVLDEATFELAVMGAVAETFARMADVLAPRAAANGGVLEASPFGVVAAILPFNWPASVLVSKVAPALIAGNTVVVKPPPTCPLVALHLTSTMAAYLPEGVLGAVSGPGIAVGEQLVAHRDVAMISLTGGIRTGVAVAQAAAARLVPALLELGGNDAGIVAPDVAPSDALAEQLLGGAFVTSGQVCMALKRLYVPAGTLDAFVDALRAAGASSVTGYGLDDGVTVGPLHTAAAAASVKRLMAGATTHALGRLAADGDNYVQAAIVVNPPRDAAIVTQEQFAPVLPVLEYATLDDAVAAANDTPFGLGASIWSHDDDLADTMARRLQAGTVFRNGHGPGGLDPSLPFGGWKQSGIGREYGAEGLLAYTQSRALPPRGRLP